MTRSRVERSGPSNAGAVPPLQDREEPDPPEPAARARTGIVIAAPRDAVFAALSDGARYAEWVVGAKEVTGVDADFPRRGSAISPRVGVEGVSAEGETAVTGVDPSRRLELLASVRPLGRARITFELDDDPAGTLVMMEEEPVGDDVTARLARRATRAVRARNSDTLWRLKVLVERDAGASRVIGSSTHLDAELPDAVGAAVARTFAWATGLRGKRVFHPRGTAFNATAHLCERAVGVLAGRSELRAVVRISRGIGLPDPFPDFNGIAIRLVDAHGTGIDQDFLLVSAPRAPVMRHVLVPVPLVGWTGHSTILPYDTPFGPRLFGVGPFEGRTIRRITETLPVGMVLTSAPVGGAWVPEVELTLTETLEPSAADALRFDPWHTGDALIPAGFLNRLRLPAYVASQAARRH